MAGYVFGLTEINAALSKVIKDSQEVARVIVAEAGLRVVTAARENFQGVHPLHGQHVGGLHPNVVTGTLRRSIGNSGIHVRGFGEAVTTVGPRTIYSRRVELGFHGTDSAGRSFRQPPHPYFIPAVVEAIPSFREIAHRRWLQSTRV